MKELADHVLGFVHSAELIEDNGVNPDSGMVDAYTFLAPMVDTDRYLNWLHRQVSSLDAHCFAGVSLVTYAAKSSSCDGRSPPTSSSTARAWVPMNSPETRTCLPIGER